MATPGRRFHLFLLASILALLSEILVARNLEAAETPRAASDLASVSIYFTSDLHGETRTLARISQFFQNRKKENPNVLVFDNGDRLLDDYVADRLPILTTRGEAISELVGACGYDACILGNHDPAFGTARLVSLLDRYSLPLLAANVVWPEGMKPKRVAPYKIFPLAGVTVAVIGTSAERVNHRSDDLLRIEPVDQAIRELVPKLRKQADIVVLLTHLPDPRDLAIARSVPGIDLILGGHSHRARREMSFDAESQTVIHKADPYGRSIGEVVLQYNGKKIVDRKTRIIEITDDMPEDPKIAGPRQKYFDAFAPEKPLAEVPRAMDREAVSRWLARAVREHFGVDGVVVPSRLALEPLAPGPLTAARLLRCVPRREVTRFSVDTASDKSRLMRQIHQKEATAIYQGKPCSKAKPLQMAYPCVLHDRVLDRKGLGLDGPAVKKFTRARDCSLWQIAMSAARREKVIVAPPAVTPDSDWPMWRYDANRGAATPHALPTELHLQWTREYPASEQAWEDVVNRDRMPYDRVYEPVVIGTTMLIGSGRGDWVTALDTRSGKEKWRFYTDGPVRLPPVAWNGKGYFTSDDGHLYCVDVETGRLVWKFRGAPGDRKVLGNSRLISAWPARGGPVLRDGVLYFAASIWPLMGTFVHALDAETGEIVWTNEGMGPMFMLQPHHAPSFAGIAPQGALAVLGDRLLVPGGRSVPGCLDRHTGELQYFHLPGSPGANRKLEGGSHVSAFGNVFLNHRGLFTGIYDLTNGAMLAGVKKTTYPVLTEDAFYFSGNPVVACRLRESEKEPAKKTDKKSSKKKKPRWILDQDWKCDVDGTGSLIKAGNRLYAGGQGAVSALELQAGGAPKVTWTAKIEGTAARLLAADGRLFVVTREGRIHAFGREKVQPKTFPTVVSQSPLSDDVTALARKMLKTTTLRQGYCLAFGLKDGRLVEAITRNSDLRVVAVDPDADKVDRLRRRFEAAGLYGSRVSVHVCDPTTFHAPPYMAVLTISENLAANGRPVDETFLKSLYHSMRPYGGVAWLPVEDAKQREALKQTIHRADLPKASLRQLDRHLLLGREGRLPGAADWTHQYGNVSNTSKSEDRLVRAPLGLLWFGGNTHADTLPRHGHGTTRASHRRPALHRRTELALGAGRLHRKTTLETNLRGSWDLRRLLRRKLPRRSAGHRRQPEASVGRERAGNQLRRHARQGLSGHGRGLPGDGPGDRQDAGHVFASPRARGEGQAVVGLCRRPQRPVDRRLAIRPVFEKVQRQKKEALGQF